MARRAMTILLATRSAGKLAEIRRICAGLEIAWRGLDEFAGVPEAPEEGETFAENARAKALYYSAATGLPALADDSGLEVDALGGAPGVHSAYYAGMPRDDDANNRKLVAALRNVPPERRAARFCCHMALAEPGTAQAPDSPARSVGIPQQAAGPAPRVVLESQGRVEGLIIDEPRGGGGFGYDPHFFIPHLGRTSAELSPDEKNAISHRGQALRAMLAQLARRE